MATYAELEAECKARYEQGASHDELIVWLHDSGASFIDTLKLLRNHCGLSLGEAKERVLSHPAWKSSTQHLDQVHEALTQALDEPEEP